MKTLPVTQEAMVLRTDFSDGKAWDSLCAEIKKPVRELFGEFQAYVEFVSDPSFEGDTPDQVLSLIPKGFNHTYLFIIDQLALMDPEHPVLVMDLYIEPGRTFRAIPSQLAGVENNLSIANMDFAEFADNAGPDGVFRGFPM